MSFQDNFPLPELKVNIPIKGKMYDFQKPGTAFQIREQRFIAGDDMGLGKTLQTIAAVTATNQFPCLVICPSSLKINWEKEWKMWTDHKPMVLSDPMKNTFPLFWQAGIADVFIVNYESLRKYFVADMPRNRKELKLSQIRFFENINIFKSVIIDEAHRVKDPGSIQSKLVRGIADSKPFIAALTGTPVINNATDIAPILAIIGRVKEFGGYSHFVDRYNTKDVTILNELRDKLYSTCYYRRMKTEVLDLPPKTRRYIEVDIENREEYDLAVEDLVRYLIEYKNATNGEIARKKRMEALVRIGILKEITVRGKMKAMVEFIKDTHANGQKLIVFGHLKEPLNELKKKFHCPSIMGSDSTVEREHSIERFQQDEKANLIICSLKAAGVGVTLTAASNVAFLEQGWHPAIMDQAEDRANRIGQKHPVTCHYLQGRDTIDAWVNGIIEDKRKIGNAVMGSDEEEQKDMDDKLLSMFMQKYKITHEGSNMARDSKNSASITKTVGREDSQTEINGSHAPLR
jgi:SWI/SNF-related matrix-associated actin-dependent regulator 1 of chromatin subfamily A